MLLRNCQTGTSSPIVVTLRTSRLSRRCRVKRTFRRVSGVAVPRKHNLGTSGRAGEQNVLYIYFVFCRPAASTAISAQGKSIQQTKGASAVDTELKLFIASRDLYKSRLACECVTVDTERRVRSHRFLSKCVCVSVCSGAAPPHECKLHFPM